MNPQSHLKKRVYSCQVGGFIDVGLLSEDHHKNSLIAGEGLLLNEGVVPIFWITSYIASLSG